MSKFTFTWGGKVHISVDSFIITEYISGVLHTEVIFLPSYPAAVKRWDLTAE